MLYLAFKKCPIFLILIFLSTSCVNTKKAIYFYSVQDTTFKVIGANMELVIQQNDQLSIFVSSLNKEATEIFNPPNMQANNQQGGSGYLVDPDGNIQFPILGLISVSGLTKKQLGNKIAKELTNKKLLIDPIVDIHILNFKVTVLGEVARPTVVPVTNEKITILEAIGFAGDLTIYAKRENVILIREENGNRIIKRINLNSTDILKSPYYYLKANDVIYAEPNKVKVQTSGRSTQIIPIVLGSLSLLAIILDRVFR